MSSVQLHRKQRQGGGGWSGRVLRRNPYAKFTIAFLSAHMDLPHWPAMFAWRHTRHVACGMAVSRRQSTPVVSHCQSA